ncbi:filamentous hemagglutinin family protein [Paenalcaligenes niemegkensis]|uniref:filamentous haemagglutinin family protein n=1 Tax=Paenalcaligenes niemegkensis TaxID=2895469 RepID=UPI001EE939F0|nr:filamentous haemagglutinin family protein [Paenalcaligenes niemegkensis]MCQ9617051.1 filamentous hemagglutinin family protein [Paenalcaligenes niemegkensis]
MTGQEIVFGGLTVRPDARWYEAAGAVYLKAGGDIVGSGNLLGSTTAVPAVVGNVLFGDSIATGNLIVHSNETDVSLVQAGGDIIYSSFTIAGPGTLEITAGGDIRMDDQASVTSVGPVQASDLRPGASIVMQAGLEPTLMAQNFNDFVNLYVNPDNQATKNEGDSLAGQPGKVVHTYQQELVDWMADRYGFGGSAEEALAVFSTLTPEQQRIFARQIYFAELRAGGREYNDADGPRFGSYLRGRNAIAALFPANSTSGTPNVYQGDITLYGGSGIHTRMGGDIQTLTPGGRQLFGVEGVAPPSTAGVITQGFGHIQMYTLGSILLGQSRIMTTAGGDILAWAAQGDINAGRGSKTTLVYTPPRRVYDQWGNLMLSSDVPSTGAGLATLDEGDMDLIAPEGTIDAGEAGIRVSGNVNIAALHVVNAANIQVQGDAVGIPVAAVVNTGALASASSASSAAATAAQETVQRVRNEARQNQPSIFSVQILGFGGESIGLD